jgi:hypothetical protein
MRRFFFTILFAALPMAAHAADKLKVQDVISLSAALRNLDGHMVVVKDTTIMIPWDFGSGSLRLRIANNISILDAAARTVEESRQAIVKEIAKKGNLTEIKPGTPEFDEFQKQYGEILASPAPGTQDLARIKASELRLDKNEIPVTVLSALKPIMDDDTIAK